MKIRESVHTKCSECGFIRHTTPEAFGCDNCATVIDLAGITPAEHHAYLRVELFYKDSGHHEAMHFCSWRCVFAKMPSVGTDYFITLPYLTFDDASPGLGAIDFWAAARKWGKAQP